MGEIGQAVHLSTHWFRTHRSYLERSPEQASSPEGVSKQRNTPPGGWPLPRTLQDHPGASKVLRPPTAFASMQAIWGESTAAGLWPPVEEVGEGRQGEICPGARLVGFIIILGPVNA